MIIDGNYGEVKVSRWSVNPTQMSVYSEKYGSILLLSDNSTQVLIAEFQKYLDVLPKESTLCNIVEKARVFATAAHAAVKQTRKYTGEPYIHHPAAVVQIVSQVPHTPEMLAAAWLHDVVEDTGVAIETIYNEFGRDVAILVVWLTNTSKKTDGNREVRKRIDRESLAQAPADAQTIKLADLIDNTKTIVERDPKFAVLYLKEKAALLEVLTLGDPYLMEIAKGQMEVGV